MVEVGTLVILLEVALQYDWTNHENAWVLGQQESTYLLVSHAFTLAGVGTVDWLLRYLAITPACGEAMFMCVCVCVYITVMVRTLHLPREECTYRVERLRGKGGPSGEGRGVVRWRRKGQ